MRLECEMMKIVVFIKCKMKALESLKKDFLKALKIEMC